MTIPRYRSPGIINATTVGDQYNQSALITLATKARLDAMAKPRNITRGGLAREILTRVAERPELLATLLPEGQ
jgi:hypothetical protein